MNPPVTRGRVPAVVLTTIPFAAVLVILSPYLWPPDGAPTSYFSDVHHQHAPNIRLIEDALRTERELPRWNLGDFAGTPTLGDPQLGLYNPVYWLLLLRPTLHSFGLMMVGYTLLGAAGFIVYARALGLSRAAAAGGAVAFTIGGKLLLHLVLPGHSVKAPFFLVPLVLWAIDRTATRPARASLAGAAGLTALLIVSLHPQILFYTAWLLVVAGVAAVRRARRPTTACATLTLAGALALALAAVHVLPFMALAGEFSRAHPELYDVVRWDAENPGARAHWHELLTGGSKSWEGHYYFGGVTLWLALLGLCAWPRGSPRRHLVWLHGSLALVFLLYGLGPEGGIQPLLSRLPGFGHFRIPARALVVLGLPVAMLAAFGIDALIRAPARRQRLAAIGAALVTTVLLAVVGAPAAQFGVLAVAAAAAGVLLDRRGHAGPPSSSHPAAGADDGTWLRPRSLVGAAVLITALAVDTGTVIAPWVAVAPEREIGALAPGLDLPDDVSRAVRVAELGRDTVKPGIPELARRRYGLETLSGYNSLIPWRFILYAGHASGYSPFDYNIGDSVPVLPAKPKLLDLLGVTHLLYGPDASNGSWQWKRSATAFPRAYLVAGPTLVPEGDGNDLMKLEMKALRLLEDIDPRKQVLLHGTRAESALAAIGAHTGVPLEPFRSVPLTTRSANRITLEFSTEHAGILVLNEPFFPGWRARDMGSELPVLRANVLFRAFVIQPGKHLITCEFTPLSWRLGWWISALAVVTTIGLALPLKVTLRAHRSESPGESRSGSPTTAV